jgi:diacylglycerol kinase (ATP)
MESPFKGETGITRLINAARHSIAGLTEAYRLEVGFRIELALAAVLAPLAFFLDVMPLEKALLVGSVLMVLVVELLNSAIEATVDRISFENHHLAKRAKDISSAAVMLSLIAAAAIWLLIVIGR